MGYVGAGGLFSFYVTSGSSFQVVIEFEENYGNTNRPANTLYLSDSCRPGYNSIFWDGRDANGYIVPEGLYGAVGSQGSIKVSVEVKAGEYHFPMLDVESNPFGVKIELANTPYNADGTLHQWESPEEEEWARTTVYYDNSLIIQRGNESSLASIGGTTRGALWEEINKQLYALEGISSKNGASRFMATSTSTDSHTLGGDYAFVDIWTYTVGDSTTLETTIEEFELIEQEAGSTAQLKGLVYYDYDQSTYNANTTYNIQKGDYPLENVKVEIIQGNTVVYTTYTDVNGNYYVAGLTPGQAYNVRVYSPVRNAVFTTHRTGITTTATEKYLTFSTGSLQPAFNTCPNVGLHYDLYNKTLQVTKEWAKNLALDPARPSEVIVTAVGSFSGTDYIAVQAVLNANNGWTHIFSDLPGHNNNGNPLEYRIVESGVKGYICQTEEQVTEGGTVNLYTLTNTPREMTIYKRLQNASETDQYFIFQVEGDTDEEPGIDTTFNVQLKVPAGSTSAYQVLTHVPAGTYSVTELGANWRYELVVSETGGYINGQSYPISQDGALELIVVGEAQYHFIFTNRLINAQWLDAAISVTNMMRPLN